MEIAFAVGGATQFIEAIVGEDGTLHLLQGSPVSLKSGDKVMLSISPITALDTVSAASLKGSVLRYDAPFESSTAPEEWEALREC